MAKKPATLAEKLDRLTERERPHGPTLRELADQATELVEALQQALDHAEALAEAADSYENAEEGKDGIDERADAWATAQDAAGELLSALNEIEAATS